MTSTRSPGANFGWPCWEGRHSFLPAHCAAGTAYLTPTIELCHPDHVTGCRSRLSGEAIIGGYVYRGSRYPRARGQYLFADYITNRAWSYRDGIVSSPRAIVGITAFGVDDDQEIYAVSSGGSLYRVGFGH